MRYKTSSLDVVFIVGYAPTEPATYSERVECRFFWNEVENFLNELPARTVPLLMLDGNGHIGRVPGASGQLAVTVDAAVGPFDAERENFNGTAIRALALQHHLAVSNSWFLCGATFHPAQGPPTRVDYVLLPQPWLRAVRRCEVWWRSGEELQIISCASRRDHRPLAVELELRLRFSGERPGKLRWDFDSIAACALRGDRRPEFLRDAEAAVRDAKVEQVLSSDIDDGYVALVCAVRGAAERHFSATNNKVTKPPELAAARARRRVLRRQRVG